MWATSLGDRTLCSDEAQLVLYSVAYLHDMVTAGVDMGEPYQTDVAMFNALQPTQQMAMLHEVAHGLLDNEAPIVELTAIREATVYAIYCELANLLQIEIDLSRNGDPHYEVRELIANAYQQGGTNHNPENEAATEEELSQESGPDSEWHSNDWTDELGFEELGFEESQTYEPPARECVELDEWTAAIEILADQILWDRDFQLEPAFADHDPEEVKAIKQYMGINENYFAVAAPDANSKEYLRLHRELVGLTSSLRYPPSIN